MYKDRGIIKWYPFNALDGFIESVNEIVKNLSKNERPILAYDQIELINYRLSESFHFKKIINITYYQNGYYKAIYGIIDIINKEQNILKINNLKIKLDDIIDVNII